jgi:hypothetical protein
MDSVLCALRCIERSCIHTVLSIMYHIYIWGLFGESDLGPVGLLRFSGSVWALHQGEERQSGLLFSSCFAPPFVKDNLCTALNLLILYNVSTPLQSKENCLSPHCFEVRLAGPFSIYLHTYIFIFYFLLSDLFYLFIY